ncbi:hypothetical protein CUMW_189970 [Citrus unshiu]|nr:hypothetical protein CUMW_189970 [Citrus unshiu]
MDPRIDRELILLYRQQIEEGAYGILCSQLCLSKKNSRRLYYFSLGLAHLSGNDEINENVRKILDLYVAGDDENPDIPLLDGIPIDLEVKEPISNPSEKPGNVGPQKEKYYDPSKDEQSEGLRKVLLPTDSATFSNGTSPLGKAEFGKQGVVVEEVVHTTIGTSEEGTIVPVIGLSEVQASGLLKSKVSRLPCPKCKADPRKNYASNKAKSGAECYSFEKKKVVDDSLKDQQVFEAAVVPGISVASKPGESSAIYEEECIDSPLVFSTKLKIAELQRLNDNCTGFAESCKKLSSELEGARSGIMERNFRITELERKVKEVEQEHSELLILRQEKQEWEMVEGVLRKELTEENDVKPQEFDKLVGYEPGWSLRHLGKDVSTIDLSEKGGISSNNNEDGYRESVIPDPDPEDGEEGGTGASTSKGVEGGVL